MFRSGLFVVAGLSGLALGGVVDVGDPTELQTIEQGAGAVPFRVFDLSGLGSFAEMGSMLNEVVSHDFDAEGSSVHILSFGWDLNIRTEGSSWLSEVTFNVGGDGEEGFVIAPLLGEDYPGTASASTGGVLDLVSLDLDFYLGPNNIFEVEIFESFVDDPVNADAFFLEGSTLTIEFQGIAPSPGVGGIVLGGLLFGARRRRL